MSRPAIGAAILLVFLIGCGVKAPPLPPLPETPQKSDVEPRPTPRASSPSELREGE